jgi:hypothetical protein
VIGSLQSVQLIPYSKQNQIFFIFYSWPEKKRRFPLWEHIAPSVAMVKGWLAVSPRTTVVGVIAMGVIFMVQEMATLRPAAQMYSTLGRAAHSQPTFDLVMDRAEMALEASAARLPSDVAATSRGAHIHRLKDLSHLMADLELEDLQAELGSLNAASPAHHAVLESEVRGGGAAPAANAAASSAQPRSVLSTAALTLNGPLVSIFTTVIDRKDALKAFIQGNTVRAYSFLAPEVVATVFTESDVWAKKARDAGLTAATQFPKNPHGTPLIKGMYNHIESTFRTPETTAFFYGYSNADILYSQTLIDTLLVIHRDIVLGRIKPRVLIVGQRINRPVTEGEDKITSKHELTPLVLRLAKTGKLFQTNAQDFFFITKGTFDWGKIPDFVIGRHAYDNWLVDYSVHHADIDVIDVTRTVHAVHQTGKDGDFAWMSKKRPPDYYWNEHRGNNAYDHGLTSESNWLTRFDAQQQVRTTRHGCSHFLRNRSLPFSLAFTHSLPSVSLRLKLAAVDFHVAPTWGLRLRCRRD